jgi:predicted ATPase
VLTEITLERFKSCRQARLPLSTLTLLIGANASGKSNAIEAIQVLSWLARGRPGRDFFQRPRRPPDERGVTWNGRN